jgi:hypothetical protein
MPYLWSKNPTIWLDLPIPVFGSLSGECGRIVYPLPKMFASILKKISIENSQIVYWNDVQLGNKTIQRWKSPNKFGWGIVLL